MSSLNQLIEPNSNVIALPPLASRPYRELPQTQSTGPGSGKTAAAQVIAFPGQAEPQVRSPEDCEIDELVAALAGDRLEVHYQPQFCLSTYRIEGFEALLRLRREDGSLLNTARVIDLAEAHDFVGVIGRRTLETAVAEFAGSAFHDDDQLQLALNVSPRELQDPGYAGWLLSLLRTAGLDPTRVELEVTENWNIDVTTHQATQLTLLAGEGLSIAVDDFGTGLANWRRVLDLPVSTVKLDRSIAAEAHVSPRAKTLIGHLLAAGEDMGFRIVAEGIETFAQHGALLEAGCQTGQGFGLARPAPLRSLLAQFDSSD